MSEKIYNQQGETIKAGAVVIHTIAGQPCVLLVYRPKHEDWQLPKGHGEAGESASQTAIREALEETGYHIQLHQELPLHTYTRKNGEAVVCHFFTATLAPTPAEPETHEIPAWIPLSQAPDKIDSANLRRYFISTVIPFLTSNPLT